MKPENLKRKNFDRIVLPVDESEGSKKVVQKALLLAKETGKEVVSLYVVDTPRLTQTIPPGDISVTWEIVLKKQGHEVLNEIEKKGKKMGVRVVKKLVEGIPDDEIVKEAKKNDIIVMGCKGRSALSGIFVVAFVKKYFVMHHRL